MNPIDLNLAQIIKDGREAYEKGVERLLDNHIALHHSGKSPFWKHTIRCAILYNSYPDHKKRMLGPTVETD